MATCNDGSCSRVGLSREEKRKEFEHDLTNPQAISQGLRDGIFSLSDHYFNYGIDAVQIEEKLHDLWDELIHAAKITPASSPEHDRFVTLVLEARDFGTFARKKQGTASNEGHEEAVLINGQRLWTDLPYLLQEFQDSWTKESMVFTAMERENVAVLTAKLCAVGACPNELSSCALWLFKEALETKRTLATSSQEGGHSKDSSPSIAEILPACLAWFRHSKFKLAKLSVANYDPNSANLGKGDNIRFSAAPGNLASSANITQNGFSVARWLFWRQRFKELNCAGNEEVAKLARACFEEVVLTGRYVGLDIPGEQRYLEKLFEALDEELVTRDSKQCVGPEDIEIDMGWADEN